MENWKEITWTDGRYYISDMGNVKSVGGKKCKREPKIMKPCEQNSGYLIVKIFKNGNHHTCLIHRLVMEAFVGNKPDMDVNHKNGNKHDNRLSNLEWCSRKENMEHCVKTGLRKDIKKVAALKDGKVILIADFSRELAEKLIRVSDIKQTSVETIARSIRKKIDKNEQYYGFTFVSIKNL